MKNVRMLGTILLCIVLSSQVSAIAVENAPASAYSTQAVALLGISAAPTSSNIIINSKAVSFEAYAINGNNYFKLRDLAYILSDTEIRFNVEYDSENDAVNLTSGTAYTVVGGEMAEKAYETKAPEATSSKVYLDGTELGLKAYNIDGNNYFRLRDIGKALNFGVFWDGSSNTITIDTTANRVYGSDYVPLYDILTASGYESISELCYKREEPDITLTFDLETGICMKNLYSFDISDSFTEGEAGLLLQADVLSGIINKELYLAGSVYQVSAIDYNAHQWLDTGAPLVAHAAGTVYDTERGVQVAETNSYEALIDSYNLGYRAIEIDFNLTSDGVLAAAHDWAGYGGNAVTSETWKKTKLKGYYTAMTLEDVLCEMTVNEDMFLITDTKSFEYEAWQIAEQFQMLYDTAVKIDPGLLNRIVPQIYSIEMYDIICDIYHYNSVIFTLYALPWGQHGAVMDFVADKDDIAVITMPGARAAEGFVTALSDVGKAVYIHTYNSLEEVQKYLSMGVRGVYTDSITPGEYLAYFD